MCFSQMEDLWFKLGQFEEFLTKMESGLSDLKPVEADLPKLESQKPNLEVCTCVLTYVSQSETNEC